MMASTSSEQCVCVCSPLEYHNNAFYSYSNCIHTQCMNIKLYSVPFYTIV